DDHRPGDRQRRRPLAAGAALPRRPRPGQARGARAGLTRYPGGGPAAPFRRPWRAPGRRPMNRQRIYSMSFASVYPLYIAKAEKKGRTKAAVDEIIRWLTGYTQEGLDAELEKRTSLEDFLGKAPRPN